MKDFRHGPAAVTVSMALSADFRLYHALFSRLSATLTDLSLDFSKLVSSAGCILGNRQIACSCHIVSDCLSLRSLTVHDLEGSFSLDRMLLFVRGRLRSLDIGGDFLPARYVDAMEAHLGGLTRLTVRCARAKKALTAVWRRLGPTFVELIYSVPVVGEYQGPINEIAWLCPKLKNVDIDRGGPIDVCRVAPELFTDMGARLLSVRLADLDARLKPVYLEKIVDACPNAVFDVALVDDIPAALGVLGGRLRKLTVADRFHAGVEQASAVCSRLEELTIVCWKGWRFRFLEAFVATPKPTLRVVRLEYPLASPVNSDGNMLDIIGSRLDSLEEFSAIFKRIEVGDFYEFALSSPLLKSVSVKVVDVRDKQEEEEAAADMLMVLLACPFLRSVVLEDPNLAGRSGVIAESALCWHRHEKGADLFLGGVQY